MNAVGSYPTFSPLPSWVLNSPMGGLFSVALAVMIRACIETTDNQSVHAQVLPGSLSMEPGLSSLAQNENTLPRPSGQL